ncbi:alpha/beta-hydrolase [Xylariomycetidae sp. FL2044]|nr:alpha/beta-hydrolase [Xylariomycetidae sp. FL2044]
MARLTAAALLALSMPMSVVSIATPSADDRHCRNLTIPISISATNSNYTIEAPKTNIEVTNLFLNIVEAGKDYAGDHLSGPIAVSGNYSIAATYCTPSAGPGSVLQILTHGAGLLRSYWDFRYAGGNYSYVDYALGRGYSTFAFDRLGLGESSHGDPVHEIQSGLEIEAMRTLTEMLRAGAAPGVPDTFARIGHVGHSYGSILTYGLTTAYPRISDGIVLTGFAVRPTNTGAAQLANGNVLAHTVPGYEDYVDGYLIPGGLQGFQNIQFAPGSFSDEVLLAAAAESAPTSLGEYLTLSEPLFTNNSFAGPVAIVTGERDLPFCGGNCYNESPSVPALSEPYFTNKTFFNATVVDRAGHGFNYDFQHPIAYEAMLQFFDEQVKP